MTMPPSSAMKSRLFRRAVFNGDVLTLGITGLIQPLAERGHEVRKPVR
jgi:hypothetical protein